MDKWQGWLGLAGICFLIFDRISGWSGWFFGRTSTEDALKRDVEDMRGKVKDARETFEKWIEKFNERSSERNSELQRIIGHMELEMVGLKKDNETMKAEIAILRERERRN